LFDDIDDELCNVMPAFRMHGPGGMQYKRHVDCSVASYSIQSTSAADRVHPLDVGLLVGITLTTTITTINKQINKR